MPSPRRRRRRRRYPYIRQSAAASNVVHLQHPPAAGAEISFVGGPVGVGGGGGYVISVSYQHGGIGPAGEFTFRTGEQLDIGQRLYVDGRTGLVSGRQPRPGNRSIGVVLAIETRHTDAGHAPYSVTAQLLPAVDVRRLIRLPELRGWTGGLGGGGGGIGVDPAVGADRSTRSRLFRPGLDGNDNLKSDDPLENQ
jgi:hypothetical protein